MNTSILYAATRRLYTFFFDSAFALSSTISSGRLILNETPSNTYYSSVCKVLYLNSSRDIWYMPAVLDKMNSLVLSSKKINIERFTVNIVSTQILDHDKLLRSHVVPCCVTVQNK